MMIDEVKISVVPEGTVLTDIHGTCPKCSYNFKGDDVLEHFKKSYAEHNPGMTQEQIDEQSLETAAMYGWTPESPKYFSRIIGIEIPGGYDGIMFHQCPECETTWNRSNKEVVISSTLKETEDGTETDAGQQ